MTLYHQDFFGTLTKFTLFKVMILNIGPYYTPKFKW